MKVIREQTSLETLKHMHALRAYVWQESREREVVKFTSLTKNQKHLAKVNLEFSSFIPQDAFKRIKEWAGKNPFNSIKIRHLLRQSDNIWSPIAQGNYRDIAVI